MRDFVRGLLAPLPHENCWTIAEHVGDAGPDGMQDLLTRVKWDDAAVRADVRKLIGRQLGDAEAVLVIDETGDLKKGRTPSASSGSIPVLPARRGPLPAESWCDDPVRRAEAGVPEQVRFPTKPQLAAAMIETAAAGLACRWVAGDEAYRNDPRLAARLRALRRVNGRLAAVGIR